MINTDTIAAPITAPGMAAVAVVRVSGPFTAELLRTLVSDPDLLLETPRSLHLVSVADRLSATNAVLDHALVSYFRAPNSYTGEDCAEFSFHGSPFIVRRFFENLAALEVRIARPGEFTERAFHNGKIDLSQAEAVSDLIAAESELQARVAQEQLTGRLRDAVSELGEPLRNTLAQIEARIDFPEEGIEPSAIEEWERELKQVIIRLDGYLATYDTGRLVRDGASVVIAGLPNAGKSSLLNRLVGDDRAIVTPIPGTTRDSIEERITLDGLSIRLWDTAGLGAVGYVPDEVERLGIEKSWKQIANADLVIYLFDGSVPFSEQAETLAKVRENARRVILVGNKVDLGTGPDFPTGANSISASQGLGLAELKAVLVENLVGRDALKTGEVVICNARHRSALLQSREHLIFALATIEKKDPAEFIALSLRSALGALDEIIGITTIDSILDRIFSQFCIGK